VAWRRSPGAGGFLSRTVSTGVEFQIVTRWESIDAIVRAAGVDPATSVVPSQVADMMIEYSSRPTR